MRNRINILVCLFICSLSSYAQNIEKQERMANSEMREGNALFQKSNFAEAEVAYKKSVATYPNNPKAIFNLGNSMMQQKRYKEAISQYDYLAKSAKSNSLRAQSYHNIGNANMGLNDFQKAVDAYKNSFRINPTDEETRYNLALAQELLKQQQEQDNKDDQNKDNKDQNKDNKDQDKDNKDQDKENKDKKDDKNKEDENKDKQDKENSKDDKKENENKDGDKDKQDKPNEDKQDPKDEKGKEEQKQQQPQPGKLSPQQMKQLLEAMQNEENKTQDKMNAKRVKGKPVKTEKDW